MTGEPKKDSENLAAPQTYRAPDETRTAARGDAAPDTRAGESPEAVDRPEDASADESTERPKEIGGRPGPDPTRYGDWEKNGRCIDF